MPEHPQGEPPRTAQSPTPSELGLTEPYTPERPAAAPPIESRTAAGSRSSGPNAVPPTAPPPARAGRYPVVAEIGRGGMGTVLEARDPDLGRPVAVKVLLPEHRDHPELVRRFLEEARISGQLQHPGIVPVHELGRLEDRRPFFAMKLVCGKTLAALLAARRTPEEDRGRFLGIFEQVCQTLAYAHARGVIHRDLKPANVMVGAFGEVQVMDWGLAKVLAPDRTAAAAAPAGRPAVAAGNGLDSPVSLAGAVMGTPAYMAPEQARGEADRLDERCDVFGLGAILCVLLTGKPPFEGPTRQEVHGLAERGDLGLARARLDACGADPELLRLAHACLAPDPADRPRDAGVVALRLTAYRATVQQRLQDAELARAAAQARAASERKARRLTVALAASVLALTLLGGGAWLAVERQDARRRAEAERKEADTAREVNQLLQQAVRLREQDRGKPGGDAAAATEALALARRAEGRLAAGPADEALRQRVTGLVAGLELDRQDRAMLDRLDRARQLELDVQGTAFDTRRAGPAYARAFRGYGIEVEHLPPAEAAARIKARGIRVELAAALDNWASLPGKGIDRPRLRAVARAADPDPWRNRLRDADADAATAPDELRKLSRDPRVSTLPAVSLYLLGKSLRAAGDVATGVRVLRTAQRLHPSDFWVNHELAYQLEMLGPAGRQESVRYYTAALALRSRNPGVHYNLGNALRSLGRTDEAIASYEEAIRLQSDWASPYLNLGVVRAERGEWDQALEALDEAIRRGPDEPKPYNNRGNVLREKGDLDGAITSYREALRLKPDYAGAWHNLAIAYVDRNQLDEALDCYAEAVRYEKNNPKLYSDYGDALRVKGRPDDAERAYRKALRLEKGFVFAAGGLSLVLIRQRHFDEAVRLCRESADRNPHSGRAQYYLGRALVNQGARDEALAALRQAVRVDPRLPNAHFLLANLLLDAKKSGEALAVLQEGLKQYPKDYRLHRLLGSTLLRQGKVSAAIRALRQAIKLKKDDAQSHYVLGNALVRQKELAGAIKEFQEAVRLDPRHPQAQNNLGTALRQAGRVDESVPCYEAAIRADPNYVRAYYNLGVARQQQGKLDDALAAFRAALRIQKDDAPTLCSLGRTLQAKGDFAPALAALRRGHALGSRDPEWREPSAAWIKECARLLELDQRLPQLERGEVKPADVAEKVEYARLCLRYRQRYELAARLYTEAFADKPDVTARNAYDAACAAARASAGAGAGAKSLDDKQRAQRRRQALDWLRADLAALAKEFDHGNRTVRDAVGQLLAHWQREPNLAGVRAPATATLPVAEREAWRKLWADVEALRKRARRPG